MSRGDLTADFSMHEFLASETAARLGKRVEPNPIEAANILSLCEELLQPIRTKLGKSVVVVSGLRPLWLNLAVGGSSKSAHMEGLAADVKVIGMSPTEFCRWVQSNAEAEDWPIDQCILEFPESARGWTHLSTARHPRMQFLTAKSINGRTVYSNGIHG